MNKLILGYGLLGSELVKKTGWDYISRKKDGFDFTNIDSYKNYLSEYDVIINCIADCNTYGENKNNHWNVNYKGVVDLVDYLLSRNKKLVHISTDYVYSNSKLTLVRILNVGMCVWFARLCLRHSSASKNQSACPFSWTISKK